MENKYHKMHGNDIQKLKNEFELLQDLKIKGVRKALDFTTENNQPRLYLEYIEGQNLRDYFKNLGVTSCVVSFATVLGPLISHPAVW